MKKYLSAILFVFITLNASAISPMDMRFHCENDTLKINELLEAGYDSKLESANELVVFYAKKLLGTPYVAHTLEGNKELLTINIDQLDCTTLIETLYALTKTTLTGRYSWRDYANNLESIRYRNGVIGDYTSRLHYISDWVVNNSARGNIKDATPNFDKCKYLIKTIDFMSKHRSSYPSLKNDTIFEKIKGFEIGYRSHRFPYIKKEDINDKNTKATFKSGDIIGMVTRTEGLDISHLGIVIKENDKLYFLNASMSGKKVQVEKNDFAEYLRRNNNCMGVRVIRIVD